MSRIMDSITDAVGMTPMVRLSRIGRDLPCELLGKCEFLNPGGSVKDRIGVRCSWTPRSRAASSPATP
jgi:cysteine synthase